MDRPITSTLARIQQLAGEATPRPWGTTLRGMIVTGQSVVADVWTKMIGGEIYDWGIRYPNKADINLVIDMINNLPEILEHIAELTEDRDYHKFLYETLFHRVAEATAYNNARNDALAAENEALKRAIISASNIIGLIEPASCHSCVHCADSCEEEPCNTCLNADRFPSWRFDAAHFTDKPKEGKPL